MIWFLIVFAVLVGAALPLQALLNARLGSLTAGSLFAAAVSMAISFAIGAAIASAYVVARSPSLPSWETLSRFPSWIWLGGVVGAAYVVAATLSVPILGASAFISLIVLGQMAGSLLLDHYGVLHAPRAADAWRVGGVLLIVAGTLLVLQPWKR